MPITHIQYTTTLNADYTTADTNWNDVDSTNFVFNIDSSGGKHLITFTGSVYTAQYVYFDIAINGSRVGGSNGIAGVFGNNNLDVIRFEYWTEALPIQTNTFALQWKVNTGNSAILYAGAGSTNANIQCQFSVTEFAI